jgi:2-polyprenyl-3-methyl-5-hydroxy-6-metoxy-1,4-benzoquinol methylase
MTKDIEFTKYKTCGAGYHWDENSSHPRKMNAFVKARYQKCIQLLRDKIGSFEGKRVVDLGCGDGVLTYELFKNGAESYGVDLSDEAIKYAKQKHSSLGSNAQFFVESCTDTHFDDGFFDAVISSDVIEHLSNPGELLSEIQRLLKPNGLAVISTPIRFTEHPLDTLHTVEWFKDEFKVLIKNTFSHVTFEYSHPVIWYELIKRSSVHRLGVNVLSYFMNPFLNVGGWRFPCMQYAIIVKT